MTNEEAKEQWGEFPVCPICGASFKECKLECCTGKQRSLQGFICEGSVAKIKGNKDLRHHFNHKWAVKLQQKENA